MIKYTICFIGRGGQILLLNRERPSWMGCWNGVGGKLEPGETPRASMIRELQEETGIESYALHFKGFVTWLIDGSKYGGMYVYLAEAEDDFIYAAPVKTAEGILDWKEARWILHPDNIGVAANIPHCLPAVLHDPVCYDHLCVYERGKLAAYHPAPIESVLECDDRLRERYLEQACGRAGLTMSGIESDAH